MDIKKTWEKHSRLSHRQALALPPIEDKQRISPRRAVYKRPIPTALRDSSLRSEPLGRPKRQ